MKVLLVLLRNVIIFILSLVFLRSIFIDPDFSNNANMMYLMIGLIVIAAGSGFMIYVHITEILCDFFMRDIHAIGRDITREEHDGFVADETRRWKLAPVIAVAVALLVAGVLFLLLGAEKGLIAVVAMIVPFAVILRFIQMLGMRRILQYGALHFNKVLKESGLVERSSNTDRVRIVCGMGRLYYQLYYLMYLYIHGAISVVRNRNAEKNDDPYRVRMSLEQHELALSLPMAEEALMQHMIECIYDEYAADQRTVSLRVLFEEDKELGEESEVQDEIGRLTSKYCDEQMKTSAAISAFYLPAALILPVLALIVSFCGNSIFPAIPVGLGLLAGLLSLQTQRHFARFAYSYSLKHCLSGPLRGAALDMAWFSKLMTGPLNDEEAEAFMACFLMKPEEFLAAARKHAPDGFIAVLYDIYMQEFEQRRKLRHGGRN